MPKSSRGVIIQILAALFTSVCLVGILYWRSQSEITWIEALGLVAAFAVASAILLKKTTLSMKVPHPPQDHLPKPDGGFGRAGQSRFDTPAGVMAVQEVLFATNRLVHDHRPFSLDMITDLWSSFYTYGRAWISIPRDHRFGVIERPKFKWLQMRKEKESPDKHFMFGLLEKLTDDAFFSALRSQDNCALIFVHGYNVSFADAIFQTAQIAFDANFPGRVVAFCWPSRASIKEYDYDRESALTSAGDLLSTLSRIKSDAKIENLFIVAHSLGSQIVIDALHMASLSGVHLNLREVIFAAPDVDRNVFTSRTKLIKEAAEGVTLYASSADKCLIASKFKAGGTPRAGDMPAGGPLLIPGIDLIDVTALGENMFALNHRVYAADRSILNDIGLIITSRTRPPHIRNPTLRRMPNRMWTRYWMHPG